MRRVMLVLPAAVLLQGCVYTSPVPLDRPGAATFDEALLGIWVGEEHDDDEDSVGVVTRAGEHEYVVRTTDCIETRGERRCRPAEYRMHRTVLRDVPLLNIYDPGDSTYCFARYEVAGDTLRLQYMQGESSADTAGEKVRLPQFTSSADLRAAVLRVLDEPWLFDRDWTVLRRAPHLEAGK